MKHITVNGVPLCQCPISELIGLDRHIALLTEGPLPPMCMNNHPNDEAAVERLKRYGVPAELTDGPCPAYYDED